MTASFSLDSPLPSPSPSSFHSFYSFAFGQYGTDFTDARILVSSTVLTEQAFWSWRLSTALFCSIVLVGNGILFWTQDYVKSFSYLTFWTLTLTAGYFCGALGLLVYRTVMTPKHVVIPFSNWELLFYLSYEVAFMFNVTVVILFWTLVYPAISEDKSSIGFINNFFVHLSTGLLCILDILFSKMQLYLRHYPWAVLWAFIYMGFNCAYVETTGISLYPTVDWKNAANTAGSLIGALVLMFLAIGLARILVILRNRCSNRSLYAPREF